MTCQFCCGRFHIVLYLSPHKCPGTYDDCKLTVSFPLHALGKVQFGGQKSSFSRHTQSGRFEEEKVTSPFLSLTFPFLSLTLLDLFPSLTFLFLSLTLLFLSFTLPFLSLVTHHSEHTTTRRHSHSFFFLAPSQ